MLYQSDGEFRPHKRFVSPFKKLFLSAPFFTSCPPGYPQITRGCGSKPSFKLTKNSSYVQRSWAREGISFFGLFNEHLTTRLPFFPHGFLIAYLRRQ
jgi:hypothetical protein